MQEILHQAQHRNPRPAVFHAGGKRERFAEQSGLARALLERRGKRQLPVRGAVHGMAQLGADRRQRAPDVEGGEGLLHDFRVRSLVIHRSGGIACIDRRAGSRKAPARGRIA